MIRALVSVVVRSLVEVALVLVVIGVLLLGLAGIVGQRIVTTNPNLVERAAERVARVLAALARGARAGNSLLQAGDGLGADPDDLTDLDEDDEWTETRVRRPELPERWEEYVV